jgi:hypothetical protein
MLLLCILLLMIHQTLLHSMDHKVDPIVVFGSLCDNSDVLGYQHTQLLHTLCCVHTTMKAKIEAGSSKRKKILLDTVKEQFQDNVKFIAETLAFNRMNTACGWKHNMCQKHLRLGQCDCPRDETTEAAVFRAQLTSCRWVYRSNHIWEKEQNIDVYKVFIPSPLWHEIEDAKKMLAIKDAKKDDWDNVYMPNFTYPRYLAHRNFIGQPFFNQYDDLNYYVINNKISPRISHECSLDGNGKFRMYNTYFTIDGTTQHKLVNIRGLKNFFNYISQIRQKTDYLYAEELANSKAVIDAQDIKTKFALSDFGLKIISEIIFRNDIYDADDIPEALQLQIAYGFHVGGCYVNRILNAYDSRNAKLHHLSGKIYLQTLPFGSLKAVEKKPCGKLREIYMCVPVNKSESGLCKYFYKQGHSIDTIHDNMTKQREQLYTSVIVPRTIIREPEYFVHINTTTDQTTNIYLWKTQDRLLSLFFDRSQFDFSYVISYGYRYNKALSNIKYAAPVNGATNLALISDTTLYVVEASSDKNGIAIKGTYNEPQQKFVSTISFLTEQELNQGAAVEGIEWFNEKKPIIVHLRPMTWIERLLKQPIKTIDPISGTVNTTWRLYNPLFHTFSLLYSLCKLTLAYLGSQMSKFE